METNYFFQIVAVSNCASKRFINYLEEMFSGSKIHCFSEGEEAVKFINDSSIDTLYFSRENFTAFDFKSLIKNGNKKNFSTILQIKVNGDEEFVQLDKNFLIVNKTVMDGKTLDGYVESGIYFIPQELNSLFKINLFEGVIGIPLPVYSSSVEYFKSRPALFLDRDGVINKDVAYLHEVKDIVIFDAIIPVIKFFNDKKLPVVVLTNQSGVARGKFLESDVLKVNQHIFNYFIKKKVFIDRFYSCPYMESGEIEAYAKKTLNRKPSPGMLFQACGDFFIKLDGSFMIGDKISDAIDVLGLTNISIQRNYDLAGAQHHVFSSESEILAYIKAHCDYSAGP